LKQTGKIWQTAVPLGPRRETRKKPRNTPQRPRSSKRTPGRCRCSERGPPLFTGPSRAGLINSAFGNITPPSGGPTGGESFVSDTHLGLLPPNIFKLERWGAKCSLSPWEETRKKQGFPPRKGGGGGVGGEKSAYVNTTKTIGASFRS